MVSKRRRQTWKYAIDGMDPSEYNVEFNEKHAGKYLLRSRRTLQAEIKAIEMDFTARIASLEKERQKIKWDYSEKLTRRSFANLAEKVRNNRLFMPKMSLRHRRVLTQNAEGGDQTGMPSGKMIPRKAERQETKYDLAQLDIIPGYRRRRSLAKLDVLGNTGPSGNEIWEANIKLWRGYSDGRPEQGIFPDKLGSALLRPRTASSSALPDPDPRIQPKQKIPFGRSPSTSDDIYKMTALAGERYSRRRHSNIETKSSYIHTPEVPWILAHSPARRRTSCHVIGLDTSPNTSFPSVGNQGWVVPGRRKSRSLSRRDVKRLDDDSSRVGPAAVTDVTDTDFQLLRQCRYLRIRDPVE